MSHCMTKPTKWPLRPAKTQISLGIRPILWITEENYPLIIIKYSPYLFLWSLFIVGHIFLQLRILEARRHWYWSPHGDHHRDQVQAVRKWRNLVRVMSQHCQWTDRQEDHQLICPRINRYEPGHDKTNKMVLRPAKIQISLGRPGLIRVFAVRMKKGWLLIYPLSAHGRLWSDWADAQADLSLRWAHCHFVCFVMMWLI